MGPERVSSLACLRCGSDVTLKDWTCPHCGEIFDRFLVSTLNARNLTGEEKEAYKRGYRQCKKRWRDDRSAELAPYNAPARYYTAYRAGWKAAAERIAEHEDGWRRMHDGLVLVADVSVLVLGLACGGLLVYWLTTRWFSDAFQVYHMRGLKRPGALLIPISPQFMIVPLSFFGVGCIKSIILFTVKRLSSKSFFDFFLSDIYENNLADQSIQWLLVSSVCLVGLWVFIFEDGNIIESVVLSVFINAIGLVYVGVVAWLPFGLGASLTSMILDKDW